MKSKTFEERFYEWMNGDVVKMQRSLSKSEFISLLNEYCDSDDAKIIIRDKDGVFDLLHVCGGGIMVANNSPKDCVFITVCK